MDNIFSFYLGVDMCNFLCVLGLMVLISPLTFILKRLYEEIEKNIWGPLKN